MTTVKQLLKKAGIKNDEIKNLRESILKFLDLEEDFLYERVHYESLAYALRFIAINLNENAKCINILLDDIYKDIGDIIKGKALEHTLIMNVLLCTLYNTQQYEEEGGDLFPCYEIDYITTNEEDLNICTSRLIEEKDLNILKDFLDLEMKEEAFSNFDTKENLKTLKSMFDSLTNTLNDAIEDFFKHPLTSILLTYIPDIISQEVIHSFLNSYYIPDYYHKKKCISKRSFSPYIDNDVSLIESLSAYYINKESFNDIVLNNEISVNQDTFKIERITTKEIIPIIGEVNCKTSTLLGLLNGNEVILPVKNINHVLNVSKILECVKSIPSLNLNDNSCNDNLLSFDNDIAVFDIKTTIYSISEENVKTIKSVLIQRYVVIDDILSFGDM